MSNAYDYIIVGSGAGGSAAAYSLTEAGRRVLLLEKGEALPSDGSTQDIGRVVGEGAFKSKEPWVDREGRPFTPEEYFNLGGKTKWYGAALLRYSPEEFGADEAHRCLAWPFQYDELVPYYREAETLLGVRQFESEPEIRGIAERLAMNGSAWESRPLPLGLAPGILEHPEEARHFDGFSSVLGLKSDAEQALLNRVRQRRNLTIVTGRPVKTLLANGRGPAHIAGVECEDGTQYRGRKVLLAAGALHSPRVLQRYLVATGLAQRLPSYAMVGGNSKLHLLTAALAFSRSIKTDTLRKTLLLLSDRFPHSSVQPLGFDGELIATLIPRFVPRPIARMLAKRAYGFFLQTEDGSDPKNRVVDAYNGNGSPTLDYDPMRCPEAPREHRAFVSGFRRDLLRAGFLSAAQPIPLSGTAHACGTLVTGNDPATSVVDASGRVHGMRNLYVVDGSVLPRSSRVNPSLTIYAWALRVADLLENGDASHVH